MASTAPTPSRRAMLGSIAALSVAAFVPAAASMPSGSSPFRIAEAHYRKVEAQFNALPADLEMTNLVAFQANEASLHIAVHAVDIAPVANWQEFAAAFDIACHGGEVLPNEDLVMKLLDDARRLARMEAN